MAGSMWSKEAVSVLIDEYQKHPCMYVAKSPLYHNRKARRDAENKIADVVSEIRPNTNPNEVKAKINGLRTQFTNERNKYMKSCHSGMGLDDTYKPSFAWYERMQFLADHVSARNRKSNLDSSLNEDMQGDHYINEETKEETAGTTGLFIDDVLCVYEGEEEANIPGPGTASNVRLHADTANESGESSKKKRKKTCPEDVVLASAATVLQSFSCKKEEDDDDFARFISSSVRKIRNKTLRLQTKHDILKIIMEAEIKDNCE
ncbi:uncharacterized protein [Anabrus simplex]|uniref:uncharacterized protein n=1 Tax=Anabrus simplex TaxID=316456 RepID=UPI0035A32429